MPPNEGASSIINTFCLFGRHDRHGQLWTRMKMRDSLYPSSSAFFSSFFLASSPSFFSPCPFRSPSFLRRRMHAGKAAYFSVYGIIFCSQSSVIRLAIMFVVSQGVYSLTNNTKGFHRFEARIIEHQSSRNQMLRRRSAPPSVSLMMLLNRLPSTFRFPPRVSRPS